MKASELLATRVVQWQELEQLCERLKGRSQRAVPAPVAARFAALYRSACADLALADAYQLLPGTVGYLHHLVGRAHNQFYRSRVFNIAAWVDELLVRVPRRLFADNYLRLAFVIFWGVLLLGAVLAYRSREFAEQVVTKEMLLQMEEMYAQPIGQQRSPSGNQPGERGSMFGYYISHNTAIGLRCFAFGAVFGIAGLYVTIYNAALLGAVFGHMATLPQRDNFFQFVTAHGPLELTAVVLSAAAGMRLGFAIVNTHGLTRMASLRRSATEAMPIMGAAMIMFVLAAMIEGFLSASPLPYWTKALTAVVTSGMLMFYFVALGYPRGDERAA